VGGNMWAKETPQGEVYEEFGRLQAAVGHAKKMMKLSTAGPACPREQCVVHWEQQYWHLLSLRPVEKSMRVGAWIRQRAARTIQSQWLHYCGQQEERKRRAMFAAAVTIQGVARQWLHHRAEVQRRKENFRDVYSRGVVRFFLALGCRKWAWTLRWRRRRQRLCRWSSCVCPCAGWWPEAVGMEVAPLKHAGRVAAWVGLWFGRRNRAAARITALVRGWLARRNVVRLRARKRAREQARWAQRRAAQARVWRQIFEAEHAAVEVWREEGKALRTREDVRARSTKRFEAQWKAYSRDLEEHIRASERQRDRFYASVDKEGRACWVSSNTSKTYHFHPIDRRVERNLAGERDKAKQRHDAHLEALEAAWTREDEAQVAFMDSALADLASVASQVLCNRRSVVD